METAMEPQKEGAGLVFVMHKAPVSKKKVTQTADLNRVDFLLLKKGGNSGKFKDENIWCLFQQWDQMTFCIMAANFTVQKIRQLLNCITNLPSNSCISLQIERYL